jgi:maltose O-acetyltransferase
MGDFAHRVTDALLASEFLPVMFRMKLMRLSGYDVATNSCVWAGASFRSKDIQVDGNVFINVGFFFDGYAHLHIEKNVRIGQFVKIITATHEIGPPDQRGQVDVVGLPVTIGTGSWIGCGTMILPGVTIAPGCVIGAGSVVTKSTEAHSVYAGVPARRLRSLEDTDAPAMLETLPDSSKPC